MARRAGSHQAGQALVLLVLLLGAALLVLPMAFEGAQAVHRRVRLATAADAAAYSAAQVQARTLNFLAYTNRAVLAHQVAMAHAVTLAAWARFGRNQAVALARNNPPPSLIGGLFGPAHGRAYLAAAGAAGIGDERALARAFDEHDRVVHAVIAQAQRAVGDGMPATRDAVVRSVLAANGASSGQPGDWRVLDDGWPGAVAWHGGARREGLKSLVGMALRPYGFLGRRDADAHSLVPGSVRCPWMRHALRRRGATDMLGLDGWRAIDSQSFHAVRSNPWIGCYYREYPMGYGAVHAGGGETGEGVVHVPDPPADFSDEAFWRWATTYAGWDILGEGGNPLADSLAIGQVLSWRGRGLPAQPEWGRHGNDAARPVRFALVVRDPVRSPMSAAAAADTYYERPAARRDGLRELPSLYQPHWHARLAALSAPESALAHAWHGGAR